VQRGQTLRFTGRVLDRPGGSLVSLDGAVSMLLEDSAPVDTTPDCKPEFGSCRPLVPYPFRASPMFRGDVGVTGGTFSGQFVVPADAALGPRGRIRGYLIGTETGQTFQTDGSGSLRYPVVSGAAPPGDDAGPNITLSFPGGATAVKPDAVLRIDLGDPSGILITGHTIQNGIIVTMDDNSTTRADVTSTFRYATNSYQAGTASFALPNLPPGAHTIKVSAADNLASGINAAAHRASATISFVVSDNPPLEVVRAFLFPSPARSKGPGGGGQFVVDVPGDRVNVLLRVYTVSGRLVRVLKAFGGLGQVQIPWDGLDDEGQPLANGTYLFHVHVNPQESDGTSSARTKAAADGRFVIINR
jgi:hypothetical protein